MKSTYICDIDGHLPVLDGVRGWAIVLVLIVHSCWVFPTNFVHDMNSGERFFYGLSEYGRLGVDLFFVLSGFLITGLLLGSKSKHNYYINFYARRALRIFPLYYIFLAVIFFITPLFVDSFNDQLQPNMYLVYFLYLQNFLSEPGDTLPLILLGAMWSLAVEEHFYLIWPAIIKIYDRAAIIKIIATLIVIALVLRCYIIQFSHMSKYWGFSWTVCRMDALLVGALLAILVRSEFREFLSAWKWQIFACLGLINVMVAMINVYLHKWAATNTFGYTLHAVFFAGIINLLLFLPKKSMLVRLFDNKMFRLFGKHSYCIYLVHAPIMYIIWKYYMSNILASYFSVATAFFFTSTVLSLVSSLFIWHVLEKHFLKYKVYFSSNY